MTNRSSFLPKLVVGGGVAANSGQVEDELDQGPEKAQPDGEVVMEAPK